MEEQKQVQAIVDSAQAAANDLSFLGNHIAASNVAALIQLTRVLYTRLNPPKPVEEPAKEPHRLESV